MQINCWDWYQSTIHIRCVNPCPPVFISVGISIHKQLDSHLDKTRPLALRLWSSPLLKQQDQIAKARVSTQQADRKNGLLQCCWIFFSLQHCVWSHELLLSVLLVSRDRPSLIEEINERGRKKRARWIEMQLYTRKKIHFHWKVGVWIVQTVPNKQ